MPPIVAFSRYPSARWASLFGSGLRHYVAGSPGHQAESSSLSYGPVSRFRLLPTSPHGDAVTFSFRPESVCLKRTCTSLNECACGRTTCRRDASDPREGPRDSLPLRGEVSSERRGLTPGRSELTSGYWEVTSGRLGSELRTLGSHFRARGSEIRTLGNDFRGARK
jgi:hypothetical protein